MSTLFKQSDKSLKLLLWALYLFALLGYYIYHHLFLLEIYQQYGVNNITIICLMVILCLLPYSLGQKLKISIDKYALVFAPSFIVMAFLANEHISAIDIICSIIVLALSILIFIRKIYLSKIPIVSNLLIVIALVAYNYFVSNTNDLIHYELQAKYYLSTNDYENALKVGKESLSIDSTLYQLRAEAMISSGLLGEKLFTYLIPADAHKLQLYESLDAQQLRDITLCNLLLEKRLREFAKLTQLYYSPDYQNLPKHYKEALTIYSMLSPNECVNFKDESVANEYKEFIKLKNSETEPVKCNNICREQYGNTYFWFYYFFTTQK